MPYGSFCFDDFLQIGKTQLWRDIIQEIIEVKNYLNVVYINRLDLINDMSLISADEVHPNIYKVQQIFKKLYSIFNKSLMI